MTRSTIVLCLKTVLVICCCAVLVAAGWLLPRYMSHVVNVMPQLAGWYGWIIAYGWLLSLPVLLALALMWQVFGTIAAGEAFCLANVVRFNRIWKLAVFDLALVAAMGCLLWINAAMSMFLVLTISGLLFLGTVAGLTSFALSGLVSSAVRLREENDMTI